MTNLQIIEQECMERGIDFDNTILLTYAEWGFRGYQVKKGEHAVITTQLWKPLNIKDKKTGEESKQMRLVKAFLFDQTQVQRATETKVQIAKQRRAN